jgi:hypothetical protein
MPAMMTAIFGFRPTTYLLNDRQMAGGTAKSMTTIAGFPHASTSKRSTIWAEFITITPASLDRACCEQVDPIHGWVPVGGNRVALQDERLQVRGWLSGTTRSREPQPVMPGLYQEILGIVVKG